MQECSLYPTSSPAQVVISVLIMVIHTGVRQDIRVVLICISLMTKSVEPFLKTFSHLRFIDYLYQYVNIIYLDSIVYYKVMHLGKH